MFVPFLRFSTDATMLAIEAQTVISARLTQFALGQGTGAETNLMVSEKILALAEAVFTVAAGGSVHEVVRGYRKHVRANMRRLSSSCSRGGGVVWPGGGEFERCSGTHGAFTRECCASRSPQGTVKAEGARPSAIGSHGTGKSARFLREAGDDEACPGYRCRVHGLHRFALALLCRRSAPRWSSIPCDGLHWARRIDCALLDVPCTIVFPRRPASQYPKRVLREDS